MDQVDPNCVLLGLKRDGFSYDQLNRAFQLLVSVRGSRLISLGLRLVSGNVNFEGVVEKEYVSMYSDTSCTIV